MQKRVIARILLGGAMPSFRSSNKNNAIAYQQHRGCSSSSAAAAGSSAAPTASSLSEVSNTIPPLSTDPISDASPALPPLLFGGPRKRLAVVRPDLIDDWIPELNDTDVQSILCSNPNPVWWHCPRCACSYQATVQQRIRKEGRCCPKCHSGGPNMSNEVGKQADQDGAGRSSTSSFVNPLHATSNYSDGSQAHGAAEVRASRPLSETHPQLAARWDTERNGLLRPSQVQSNSTLTVWWLPDPAQSSPSPSPLVRGAEGGEGGMGGAIRGFQRPIFAMVEDSVSTEEKLQAQAALEVQLLRDIRRVARIEEAGRQGSFPASLYDEAIAGIIDGSLSEYYGDEGVRAGKQGGSSGGVTVVPADTTRQRRAEMHPIVQLWKSQAAVYTSQHDIAKMKTPATATEGRDCFFETEMPDRYVVGAAYREAILNAYTDFAIACRSANSNTSSNISSKSATTPGRLPPSPVTDYKGFLAFYTLSAEEVRPGRVPHHASLAFGMTSTATHSNAALSAPSVTTTIHHGAFKKYPRLPPRPRMPEENVAEATPQDPFASAMAGGASGRAQGIEGKGTRQYYYNYQSTTDGALMWGELPLSAEYPRDGDDLASQIRASRALDAKAAAGVVHPYDREHYVPSVTTVIPQRPVVGRSFHLVLPSAEATQSSAGARKTSATAPAAASSTSKGSTTTTTTTRTASTSTPVLKAPRTPRKVARAKRAHTDSTPVTPEKDESSHSERSENDL